MLYVLAAVWCNYSAKDVCMFVVPFLRLKRNVEIGR